jgi:hypothetical protein
MRARGTRNHRRITAIATLLTVLIATSLASAAGSPAAIGLGKGSVLWLEGKSSMHDFECRSSQVTAAFSRTATAADPADAAQLRSLLRTSDIEGLELTVPVATLKSGKDGLDKNMRADLKAEKNPEIRFRMKSYTLAENAVTADTVGIQAEGTLFVAGEERPATISGRLYAGDGGMWLDGRHALRMTDFGVTPRKMMMGALKVRDDITVRFHLLLVPSNSAAQPAVAK